MTGVTRQIIGSFEDIGKDVLRQASNVPKDVLGKALESLGTSSGKKQQGQTHLQLGQEAASKPNTPLDEVAAAKDRKTKQAIARAALQYLAKKPEEREPSIRERLEKEKQQKELMEKKQKEEAEKMKLVEPKSHPRRGNLPGLTRKQTGSETQKNVRAD